MTVIKAILFDLDDTLLDDTKATLKYRRQFYNRHKSKIPFSFEEFFQTWEKQVLSDLKSLAEGTSSILDSRRTRIRIVLDNHDMSEAEADEYIHEYRQLYEDSWALYEDTIPSLIELHDKYPLGIVTNGDKEQQFRKIRKFNLQNYFELIVSCEDAKAVKPEKKIFDFSASRLGVKNSECLFVGDGYERDAVGSRDAGMNSVWLLRNGMIPDKSMDRISIIRSLAEISRLPGIKR